MPFLDLHRFDHLSEAEVIDRIGALLATAILRHGCLLPAPAKPEARATPAISPSADPALLVKDPTEQQIVRYLAHAGMATPHYLRIDLDLSGRTVARKLARLRAAGLIEVSGHTKAARYRLRTEFGNN